MAKGSEKFVIIDGNALLHRAWHALPPLTTKDGKLVNAVYGFASIMLNIIKELRPEYGVVAFDPPGKTFRHERYGQYKATRQKQPNELYEQIPLIKEVAAGFGFGIEELPKYEADDVIGTLAAKMRSEDDGVKVIIVTGDMDALQLVKDGVVVYTLKRGISETVTYDAAGVKEKYGFGPEKVVQYKALAGDSSDNIPGVPGVGEKTAKELLAEFDSIDEIYKYVENSPPARLSAEVAEGGVRPARQGFAIGESGGGGGRGEVDAVRQGKIKDTVARKLLAGKKQAFLSRELATIEKDAKIKFSKKDLLIKPAKRDELLDLFSRLQFKSLLRRAHEVLGGYQVRGSGGQASLFAPTGPAEQKNFKIRSGYHLINDSQAAADLAKKLNSVSALAVDTETDDLGALTAKMIGFSLSAKAGEAYYVTAPYLAEFKKILQDSGIKKYGHNIKYDIEVFAKAGVELGGVEFDTKIGAYLLYPGARSNSLDNLAFTELKHEMTPIESLIGPKGKKQISMAAAPLPQVADYAAEDADYTFRLQEKLRPQLQAEKLWQLFSKIEMPLIPVLVSMEQNGVKIDVKFLQKMSGQVGEKIAQAEKKIYKLAGRQFNVASPQQLKEILFGKLGLSTQGIGKTKTGFSTAAGQLEKMLGKHPIIPLIMEHRELAKLKNTYLDALPQLVNQATGRVHASFNQTVVSTGRLSSSDPNLQNIPIRTELGREIRKAFIAERGFKLISADYSQIELRVAADLSGDKEMIKIFQSGKDIHATTAAFVHQIPEAKVTPEIRRTAKEVNFGVLYGMGARGLASRTGIGMERAREFIDKYFTAFPGLKIFIEKLISQARRHGFVQTKYGRRLQLPDINSGVQQIRAAAERLATNMPMQGTAADIMKMAMIEVFAGLRQTSPAAKILMQVHDELVLEAPAETADKAAKFVKREMEAVVKLNVPVEVEVHIGDNWQEAH